MSRFRKLSHTIWHCQYHILWTPKYRLRILTGQVADELSNCIRAFSGQKGCEVVELNVQIDHNLPACHGTTQDIYIRLCRNSKRENSNSCFQ